MQCPCLKIIVDLIKSYTKYNSNTLIAKRVGISEATLRGYWDRDKVEVPTIPQKNVDAFCELVMEVVPRPLSKESARQLLSANAINLHNALLPVGGSSWKKLIDNFGMGLGSDFTVVVKPIADLSFGEPDDENIIKPDTTVKLDQPFYFKGSIPWRGEAVVIAEHLGEFHICMIAQGQRISQLAGGAFDVPPQNTVPPVALRERTKSGLYRYFVIAVKGSLTDLLREQLHTANPPEQYRIDMLADLFMDYGESSCLVMGATVFVEASNEVH